MKNEIKNKFVTLRLPISVMEELRLQASQEARTVQGQILYYLQKALAKKVN